MKYNLYSSRRNGYGFVVLAIDKVSGTHLYRQVAELVAAELEAGTLRPGDRLPSLRRMAAMLEVSIPTVKQAYEELERQGRVTARPQSGFYVQAQRRNAPVQMASGCRDPVEVCCRSLVEQVYDAIHRPGVIPLGIANPSMVRPAAKMLHRTMKRVMARAEERSLGYAPMLGDPGLRRQIAFRYLDLGGGVAPEDVIITNGGQEALALALQACAKAGDVIAVESPTYSGILELIESLGMLALEIETCPESGVSLAALAHALDRQSVRACLLSSSLNNPLGSLTSDEHRRELVALLESRGVILIEDDVYGDLVFDGQRPKPAQFFARRSGVLTCGSFSKTAAPGYRIGWLLPGRFREAVSRLKRSLSCSSGLLQQLTLSEFLSGGDYDRHLKALRPVLKCNSERMGARIARSFPAETRVSQPRGGSVLWLELPGRFDSERLFKLAIDENISISPGVIYAPDARYRHFIRLSFGHPWDDRLEQAIDRLGALLADA